MKFRTLAAKDPSPNILPVLINPGYGGTVTLMVPPHDIPWEYRITPGGEWTRVDGGRLATVEGLEPDTVYDVEARRCTG